MRADRLVSLVLLLRRRGRLTADVPARELEVSTRTVLRDIDLLSRRPAVEEVPGTTMTEVRRAVLAGHRLRIHYAATGQPPRWRTVDPIGLVTVRDRAYLLATREGEDRTYRLSRVLAAEELPEPARRPNRVDLDRAWRERCAQFLSEDHIAVQVRVRPERREELLTSAVAVRAEEPGADGRLHLEVTFQDLRHAVWALWQLDPDAEALTPPSLRAALLDRAATIVARYRDGGGQGRDRDGAGQRRDGDGGGQGRDGGGEGRDGGGEGRDGGGEGRDGGGEGRDGGGEGPRGGGGGPRASSGGRRSGRPGPGDRPASRDPGPRHRSAALR
jgi:predicted DNA-binding transcriptional regulator YafY